MKPLPSPLARALGRLSPEALAFVARALAAGRPGVAPPHHLARELLDAQIAEQAKEGISEFPYRIPQDTWLRLNQLIPLVEQLRTDPTRHEGPIADLEAECDRRNLREKNNVIGWMAAIIYFFATRLAALAVLLLVIVPGTIFSFIIIFGIAVGAASPAWIVVPIGVGVVAFYFRRVLRRDYPTGADSGPSMLTMHSNLPNLPHDIASFDRSDQHPKV